MSCSAKNGDAEAMPVPPIDQPTVIHPVQERTHSDHLAGQIYLDGKPVTIEELKASLTTNDQKTPRQDEK
jgi:hypothetical protein